MVTQTIKYVGIGAVVAAAIFAMYFFMRNSPESLYKRAMSLHKQGELYYNDGDNELAEEYYREAEMLREKARVSP